MTTGKSNILKQWKPELKALGFAYRDNMFLYEQGEPQPLQFGVSIQKNVRGETFKINPTVLLNNPLVDASIPEVVLLGNLRRDGVYLHIDRTSWWPEEELSTGALEALKKYGLPWFHRIGGPGYLAEAAEKAIQEKRDLADVIEPMDESATALPWATGAARKVGPIFFYQASVLHYLNGNRQKASERTKDWLNSLSPGDAASRIKAQTQIERLT